MRKSRISEIYFFACIGIIVTIGAYVFHLMSNHYPYYFIWDMDVTTTSDAILIQSHYLPAHINHPGFGMYLWLTFVQKLAYLTHFISILNLNDMVSSLNPLAGVVELTEFFRENSVFMAVAIPTALWLAVETIFEITPFLSILILLFFFTQEALLYHSAFIRSEIYSVFFWCLSILFCALGSRENKIRRFLFYLFMAGVFIGLSFLTKIQVFIYLLMTPVFLILFATQNSPNFLNKIKFRQVAFLNLIVFAGLLIASYFRTVPGDLATFETNYRLNTLGVVFIVIFTSLAIFEFRKPKGFLKLRLINILCLGFLFSYLLHFMIYPEIRSSVRYLLLDTKMLFWRRDWGSVDGLTLMGLFSNLTDIIRTRPIVYFANMLSGIYVYKISKKEHRFLVLILLCLLNVNLALQRQILRDILWMHTALNFTTAIFIAFISLEGKLPKLMPGIAVLVLIVSNLVNDLEMPRRVDANFNTYGWEKNFWFTATYPGEAPFSKIMNTKYDEEKHPARRAVALRLSEEYKKRRRTAQFVFPNQTISQRNIGILNIDFPVWEDQQDSVLRKVPQELENSVVVDNARIQTSHMFLLEELVTHDSEAFEKLQKKELPSTIAVLTRKDLAIYLFVEKQDTKTLVGKYIQPTKMLVTLDTTNGPLVLYGFVISNYSEISKDKLSGRYFFVIKN